MILKPCPTTSIPAYADTSTPARCHFAAGSILPYLIPGGGEEYAAITGLGIADRLAGPRLIPNSLARLASTISYRCSQTAAEALCANHLATGALAWSCRGAWQLQRGELGGPAGGHLCAMDPSGTVVGLDPVTGQTQYAGKARPRCWLWTTPWRTPAAAAWALCAYRIADGSRQWNALADSAPDLAAEAGGCSAPATGPR